MEDKEGCSMSIADMAFVVMVIAKVFFDAEIEMWVLIVPLGLGFIYDVIELILKMHNKSKK